MRGICVGVNLCRTGLIELAPPRVMTFGGSGALISGEYFAWVSLSTLRTLIVGSVIISRDLSYTVSPNSILEF